MDEETTQRIEALEAKVAELSKPCVYEARPIPMQHLQPAFNPNSSQWGGWCTRHGWNCPNAR